MPKPSPADVLAPILARWQALIPELAFELGGDAGDVVITIRVIGGRPATARIRREFLNAGSEQVAPFANRAIGAAIGSAQ